MTKDTIDKLIKTRDDLTNATDIVLHLSSVITSYYDDINGDPPINRGLDVNDVQKATDSLLHIIADAFYAVNDALINNEPIESVSNDTAIKDIWDHIKMNEDRQFKFIKALRQTINEYEDQLSIWTHDT